MSRRRSQEPIFFQGKMYVNTSNDVEYQLYYAVLQGRTIYCFRDRLSTQFIFDIPLHNLKDCRSRDAKLIRDGLPLHGIYLLFEQGTGGFKDVKIRVESASEKDEWLRYLNACGMVNETKAVVTMSDNYVFIEQLQVVRIHALLPGQIRHFEKIIQTCRNDYAEPDNMYTKMHPACEESDDDHYIPVDSQPWFYDQPVERKKAEDILYAYEELGNLLIRRRCADDEWRYAVSLLETGETRICKHYKVKETDAGFIINLSTPPTYPPFTKLSDVKDYFMHVSNGAYKPLTQKVPVPANEYDKHIATVPIDNELQSTANKLMRAEHYDKVLYQRD